MRATATRASALAVTALAAALASGCARTTGAATGAAAAPDDVPATRNFAGTWVLDSAAASRAGQGGRLGAGTGQGGGLGLGPPPERLLIQQTDREMVVEQVTARATSRLTYRLDGRTARNTVLIGGGAARAQSQFLSVWRADTLSTTFRVQAPSGVTREYRELRWLDADGVLVVIIGASDGFGGSRRSVYRRGS